MQRHQTSRSLCAFTVALFLGMVNPAAHADRYDNNGVPADLYGEIQTIKTQLAGLQTAVDGLTSYLETETAGTGEAYSEICFNAKLGVLANGSIAVQGTNTSGIGTGVDIYGLLDINAGIQGKGRAELAKMLESGVDMSVRMCLNAGVTNVVGIGLVNEPIMAPAGMQDVLDETHDALTALYGDLPYLVATLPVGADSIGAGIGALHDAASVSEAFETTTLLSSNGWADVVEGLPGADVLEARYYTFNDVFASLEGGDVCGYYGGLLGSLNPSLANSLSQICTAVPSGIDTSINAMSNAVDVIYTNNVSSINLISFKVDNTHGFLTNSIYPVLNSNTSTLNNIKSTVDDISDALP